MTTSRQPASAPVPLAYGLDLAPGRLLLAKSVRAAPATLLCDCPLDASGAPVPPQAAAALAAARADVLAGRAALAIAAPPQDTFLRRLHTPFSSPRKAARVWLSLLDLDLPFPVEQAATCLAPPVPNPSGGLDALAAALPAAPLRERLETLEAPSPTLPGGLPVTHVDALAPALYAALTRRLPPARPDAARALVWLDTSTVVVARGTGPAFHSAHLWRTSPLAPGGPDAFLPAWRTRAPAFLELPSPSAPPPIPGSPPGASPRPPALDLYFAGPGAADAALVATLSAALPPAVRASVVPSPRDLLATALAERAAAGTTWQLRAPPLALHPAWAARQNRLLRRAAALVLALALLVIALDAAILFRRSRRLAAVRADIATLATSLSATGAHFPKGQELVRLRPELDASADAFAALAALLSDAPSPAQTRLADLLEALADYDLRVTSLALSDDGTFALDGLAAAPAIPSLLADALARRDWTVQTADTSSALPAAGPVDPAHPHAFALKASPATSSPAPAP